MRISDFGLRIWDREPAWESFQSAIRNPQSELPARVGPFKVPCAGYSLNSMHPVQKKAAWIPLIHAAQRELDPVYPSQLLHYPLPLKK